MSTETEETRIGFDGTCFRCGGPGHWAESETCPWLRKAGSAKEHMARIDDLVQRFHGWQITPHQKQEFIRHENELWRKR